MDPKKNYTLDISHMADEVDPVVEAIKEARLKLLAIPVEERPIELPTGIFELGVDGRFKLTDELESFLVKLGVTPPTKAQA